MIKTKSILEKKSESDGTRICIMRYVKDFYVYDEWLRDLAPSAELLNDSRKNRISWSEYEQRYLKEMEDKKELIKELKKRSDDGEVITLLCWEKDDKFCHRRLLKSLNVKRNFEERRCIFIAASLKRLLPYINQ